MKGAISSHQTHFPDWANHAKLDVLEHIQEDR